LIRKLLKQFRKEVLPPTSPTRWIAKLLALALLLAIGGYLAIAISPEMLVNLLAGPALVLGMGILLAIGITWNEEWENFWVIEHQQNIVACAKLRRYSRYSLLHDLYVVPEWRSQGLGSHLVYCLGKQATKPLYLTCLPGLVQFYHRLGFAPVSSKNLPPLLQYDLGIPDRLDVVPLMLK
jgi:amino-acid N-acetyltransferase